MLIYLRIRNSSSVLIHSSSVLIHSSSVLIHSSSVLIHSSSVLIHSSSVLIHSSSVLIFRNSILKFIRPSANSVFNSHDPKVIKCITRLRLILSHLWGRKFKHSFQALVNPISNCRLDIDPLLCYLLHYSTHTLPSTIF